MIQHGKWLNYHETYWRLQYSYDSAEHAVLTAVAAGSTAQLANLLASRLTYSSTMKVEAVCSTKTLIFTGVYGIVS
jgi:hypothetical protein